MREEITDTQMEMIANAYNTAWMASLAWNRGMDGFPAFKGFLWKWGLTDRYRRWWADNREAEHGACRI